MASTHDIVIIGASFAGLGAATNLLKNILPKLTSEKGQSFKVTQIAPNTSFLFKIGLPRMIVKPDAIPLEKGFLPIAPAFEKFGEQYQFIQAYVTSIDHASKTLALSTEATVTYDTLIITSGSTNEDYWSNINGDDKFLAALKDLQDRIPKAESILIGGGGPAGVETAGELGDLYGKTKDITIISGSSNLLSSFKSPKPGRRAQSRLERQGIKVINDAVKVVSHTKENGKDIVKLSNGETRMVDVYIQATGDKPATSFVPKEWLNEKNKVKTNPHTLRLDVPGVTGVYVYGAAGSYSDGVLFDVKFAEAAFVETLRNDLSGAEPGPRSNKIYKKVESDFGFVAIGAQGGVGIIYGWQAPSFMVWLAKCRTYFIEQAPSSLP